MALGKIIDRSDGGDGSGLRISWGAIGTIAILAGGVATAYVFATKTELAAFRNDADKRVVVVEQTVKHHDEAISEIKSDVKDVQRTIQAIDTNIRTMLLEVGVPRGRIAKPEEP